jgi:microsomal dipeptidase-like Zn-dependent dipeptidase
MTDLWGYADLHCHPMANLGYGGDVGHGSMIFGKPTGPLDQALPCCTHAHGIFTSGSMLPKFLDHAHNGDDGYPTFVGWPRHDTQIHQQMYVDWIRRAHASGLRLMVATCVNNEQLGALFCGPGTDVSDGPCITRQITATKQMIRDNATWMALATTPAEARLAISSGKLAVVLGVEVDSVLGGKSRRPGDYDAADADKRLTALFRMGVRMITPIHLADTALGGCAMFDDRFALSNHYLNDFYQKGMGSADKWMKVDGTSTTAQLDGVQFLSGAWPEASNLIALYGHGFPDYRAIRKDGHANVRGLSDPGQDFLKKMMKRGMLIDIDHMSMHTTDGALSLAETHAYPLVSSHVRVRGIAVQRPPGVDWIRGVADEGMKSDRQLARLKSLGSVIGIITHLGPVRGLGGSEAGGAARTRSYDTSESWAIAYKYVVEHLGMTGVGLGTDFNGFYGQPGPRFEETHLPAAGLIRSIADHLGADDVADHFASRLAPLTHDARPIQYGKDIIPGMKKAIERALVGKRSYDLNVDGLAHYGMVPDFLVDIALQSGGWDAVAPMFRSAQAVLTTWQTCLDRSPGIPV